MKKGMLLIFVFVLAAFMIGAVYFAAAEDGREQGMNKGVQDNAQWNGMRDDKGRMGPGLKNNSDDWNSTDNTTREKILEHFYQKKAEWMTKFDAWKIKKLDNALAHNQDYAKKLENLNDQQANILLHLSRAEQRRILALQNDSNDSVEKELQKFRIERKPLEDFFKKREIAKEKLDKAETDYRNAQEKFKSMNDKYKDTLDKFSEFKDQYRLCQNSTEMNTTRCQDLNNKTIDQARQVIINSADRIIEHLNKVKAKIQSSEDLDEQKAQELITGLDNAIAKLQDAKKQAQEATTKDEIKAAAQNIKSIWKDYVQSREKIATARLLNARVWNIIQRSNHLETRLDQVLSNMQNRSINVSDIQDKLDAFSDAVADAKVHYDNATSLIKKAEALTGTSNSTSEIDTLVNDAREQLRLASEDVKKAHDILIDIVQAIKQKGFDIPSEPPAMPDEQAVPIDT
jgi:hypothetical protein